MPHKGRGTASKPGGRFEPYQRETDDDGWTPDEEAPPLVTSVTSETVRSIISRNDSPDIGFDRSINPYRGCEHGCIYCYARPTHAYLGLSPGLDFESRLFAKVNAADVLRRELRRAGYRPRTLMLGANTDPYQPIERSARITRNVLSILADCNHPVAVTTKSGLIVRDLDLLAPMAARRLVSVGISLTTLDHRLALIMEPRASSPRRRLATITALTDAGVPVAVLAAPMIPFVNDHELERILVAAAKAGARSARYTLVRLPLELKEMFETWLRDHFPDRADRVLARIRDCRGGKLYDADFATRMQGSGDYARLLARRFAIACRRMGLRPRAVADDELDATLFRPPPASEGQLSLF